MNMFLALASVLAVGASAQEAANITAFIDNPGGACAECGFHPRGDNPVTAMSADGTFKGKVSFEIEGVNSNDNLRTSGSVKVTVYEVGVQTKVSEHSFDYWTCPRAPADCDACVGTYDSGEFVKFSDADGTRCSTQNDFVMAFTLPIPDAQRSGHFTLSIVAQPDNSQHQEGKLDGVWEVQFIQELPPNPPTLSVVNDQLPIDMSNVITNPGGACSTCSFVPTELVVTSPNNELKGPVTFQMTGVNDGASELITSGSVKVTLYEVGSQHKVAEHSFDYWTCPRAPADCDACVGTYDSGEFVQFAESDGKRCKVQKNFLMQWTMDVPAAASSGTFTFSIVAQPAESSQKEGELNAVIEINASGPPPSASDDDAAAGYLRGAKN